MQYGDKDLGQIGLGNGLLSDGTKSSPGSTIGLSSNVVCDIHLR